jgi:hypothetical protein
VLLLSLALLGCCDAALGHWAARSTRKENFMSIYDRETLRVSERILEIPRDVESSDCISSCLLRVRVLCLRSSPSAAQLLIYFRGSYYSKVANILGSLASKGNSWQQVSRAVLQCTRCAYCTAVLTGALLITSIGGRKSDIIPIQPLRFRR